jgi:hypothetical protein
MPGVAARNCPSAYQRINSRLRPQAAHNQTITASPPRHLPVTESVALPPDRGKHHAPISTPVVRHSIRRNCAPRLSEVQGPDDALSIEPARARGVDLHTFECAVCNQVLKTFAAYEDPMKSKDLGR